MCFNCVCQHFGVDVGEESYLEFSANISSLGETLTIQETGINFSVAGFNADLKRILMPFVIDVYLPSGLLIVISWIGFVIPADKIPGRMALLVTILLMLINLEVQVNLKQVSQTSMHLITQRD